MITRKQDCCLFFSLLRLKYLTVFWWLSLVPICWKIINLLTNLSIQIKHTKEVRDKGQSCIPSNHEWKVQICWDSRKQILFQSKGDYRMTLSGVYQWILFIFFTWCHMTSLILSGLWIRPGLSLIVLEFLFHFYTFFFFFYCVLN